MSSAEQDQTLDPPGSIAVIGAGPLGCEAALYGRFLGYKVTLIEAIAVGQSMRDEIDRPLPMLPDRCLSPLAISALRAQRESDDSTSPPLPTTIGDWILDALVPLTETDLLRGRTLIPARVSQIVQVPVADDEKSDDEAAGGEVEDDIPPDFRLTLERDSDGEDCIDVEAVILAVGPSCEIQLGFQLPTPYFFRVGEQSTEDAEKDLVAGFRQIVGIFAKLAGRDDLDLYRPRRV